jgi:hypothetical protein
MLGADQREQCGKPGTLCSVELRCLRNQPPDERAAFLRGYCVERCGNSAGEKGPGIVRSEIDRIEKGERDFRF